MRESVDLRSVREILWRYGKTLRRREGLVSSIERLKSMDSINCLDKLIENEKKLEKFDKINKVDVKRVERALNMLTKEQKEILITKHIENLSYETASYRMWRKKAALKDLEEEALRELYRILMS